MREIITIHNKQFKPYISEKQIAEAVKLMSEAMNKDLKNEQPIFLTVLNGAFMFAADLLKQIDISCEVSFIKLASYQGMSSLGGVTQLIGLNEDVKDRTVVILEDIVETGLTINSLVDLLNQRQVKQIKVAAAFMKNGVYKQDRKIDYIGIEIGDEFVVGYGLDYNGLGRNLKEVYVKA
jgi:hypoxanthine phosphoribosyltransferase